MATRSTIALEFADGTIGQVYAHWDGYLAHNGKMLLEHYSNPFILRDLIDLGSISSLAPTIGTKHAFSHYDNDMTLVEFNNQYGNMTTFYGRDRGETNTDATYFTDYEHFWLTVKKKNTITFCEMLMVLLLGSYPIMVETLSC